MAEQRRIRNDIVAVSLLALIVFLIASLGTYDPADPAFDNHAWLTGIYQPDQLVYPANEHFNNACGRIGAWTADLLLYSLGVGAYYLVIGLIAMEVALFRRQSVDAPWLKTIGWGISLFGLTTLSSFLLPNSIVTPLIGPGGYLGVLGKGLSSMYVGFAGGLIFASFTFLVGMMMWTEYLIFRTGRVVFAPTFMAFASMLPFGLVYGFARWFNGSSIVESDEEEDEHEVEEDDESEHSPKFRHDTQHELRRRRTIKFRQAVVESDPDDRLATEEDEEVEDHAVDQAGLSIANLSSDDDEIVDPSDAEESASVTLPIAHSTAKNDQDKKSRKTKLAASTAATPSTESSSSKSAAPPIPKPHFKLSKRKQEAEPSEREIVSQALAHAETDDTVSNYELPDLSLLSYVKSVPFDDQKRDAERNAIILEKTCKEFGHDVRVVEIEIGPVISQYEIELAPGLRLQKIVALADDLAIAMRVPSVRIVAPIPGKNSVGVEVPNRSRQIVGLRQLIEQTNKEIRKMKIPLFLGADAVGAPLVADLAALPHLLIAGRTGTGKSVCLNAIITSILMTRRPDEVRMLMIDPKMVELSGYARLPHLMHPVVTDMRKAEAILAWAVDKMEERYSLLARVGVRHVTSFNQLGEEEIMERLDPQSEEERANIPINLPFIVIIADEIADLMMTAGKDVEAHIIRLAQKSRAVGIHLILATQKPTVDVITGLIKSNLPARIAFQVASKVDSRVVLDEGGADKLLGMGDMLFLAPGTSTLLRGQGTYLSDDEIEAVTDAVSTGEQDFAQELMNIKIKEDEKNDDDATGRSENRDKLYEEAVTMVVREQRGSTSMLQQKLQIGYGRAARLIDFMAEDGYLGPYNGSKAREVLISEAQWEVIRSGLNDENGPTAFDQIMDKLESGRPDSIPTVATDDPENDATATEKANPLSHTTGPHFGKRRKSKLKSLDKKTGRTSQLAANQSVSPVNDNADDTEGTDSANPDQPSRLRIRRSLEERDNDWDDEDENLIAMNDEGHDEGHDEEFDSTNDEDQDEIEEEELDDEDHFEDEQDEDEQDEDDDEEAVDELDEVDYDYDYDEDEEDEYEDVEDDEY